MCPQRCLHRVLRYLISIMIWIFIRFSGVKQIVLLFRRVRSIVVIQESPFYWVSRAQPSIFTHIKFHITKIEKAFTLSIATRLLAISSEQHQVCEHEILHAYGWCECNQKLPGHILTCRLAFEQPHVHRDIMSLFELRIVHVYVHRFNVSVLILWLWLEILPDIWEQLVKISILSLHIDCSIFHKPYQWDIEYHARFNGKLVLSLDVFFWYDLYLRF